MKFNYARTQAVLRMRPDSWLEMTRSFPSLPGTTAGKGRIKILFLASIYRNMYISNTSAFEFSSRWTVISLD